MAETQVTYETLSTYHVQDCSSVLTHLIPQELYHINYIAVELVSFNSNDITKE